MKLREKYTSLKPLGQRYWADKSRPTYQHEFSGGTRPHDPAITAYNSEKAILTV
jgi:hypothetical protein